MIFGESVTVKKEKRDAKSEKAICTRVRRRKKGSGDIYRDN